MCVPLPFVYFMSNIILTHLRGFTKEKLTIIIYYIDSLFITNYTETNHWILRGIK